MKGSITFVMEGLPLKEVERRREIIHAMIEAGVFDIKNGRSIINFDKFGDVGSIENQEVTFRKSVQVAIQPFGQYKISKTEDGSNIARHS